MNDNNNKTNNEENYSLNDDRRVKVLSPSAMVMKRFLRNKIAVTGLVALVIMFLFSFLGGFLMNQIKGYDETKQFYKDVYMRKDYAGATLNEEFRFTSTESGKFTSIVQAQMMLAMRSDKTEFSYSNIDYYLTKDSENFYTLYLKENDELIGIAHKEIVSSSISGQKLPFEVIYGAIKAVDEGLSSFNALDNSYTLDDDNVIFDGDTEIGYVSRYIVSAKSPDVFLPRDFKLEVIDALEQGLESFTSEYMTQIINGEEVNTEFTFNYDAAKKQWSILRSEVTTVFDRYAAPSAEHWLGTDTNGMDMLTRLMYGGRISLVIGFVVVIIGTVLGVIMGGISGYFGGWVDNLIMRIVDVFYCIPSTPILIILGAAMDAYNLESGIRMMYLMLILGFLGWPGIARLVRGQILSLREEEFMTATEACGIKTHNRIFKHLIPNVIPQLIVSCTMSLGSTILTEATLSFLGLGVRYPFASWGNIINDVTDTYVLTNYLFIWIPAGVCLLITVVAFNLVGDGLRDAFDPRMKR